MKKFIIELKFGGLGDHLFFSHIPRIAKTLYDYDLVYISNKSEIRSDSTKKLVWDLNPYVDGYTDEEGVFFNMDIFNSHMSGTNILDKVMLAYGFEDNIRFHEPEIYYEPNLIKEYQSSVIFDPNYISNIGLVSHKKLNLYLSEFDNLTIMKKINRTVKLMNDYKTIEAFDIFSYCDIIYSCKSFVCMTSGGATLSAALNKNATVIYGLGQQEFHRHSKLHIYMNLSKKNARIIYFFYKILHPLKSLIK